MVLRNKYSITRLTPTNTITQYKQPENLTKHTQ